LLRMSIEYLKMEAKNAKHNEKPERKTL